MHSSKHVSHRTWESCRAPIRKRRRLVSAVTFITFATIASFAQALETTTPVVVSTNLAGGPVFGPCSAPRFSSNANHIGFYCASADLVPNDNNGYDTFVKHLTTGVTERVSVDSNGQEHRESSSLGFPSDDGAVTVFRSDAFLHPDSDDGLGHDKGKAGVFIRYSLEQITDVVARTDAGNGNSGPFPTELWDVSHAEHDVVFVSRNSYVGPDNNSPFATEVFVRNWISGDVDPVSRRPDGGQSDGRSNIASISDDGRFVAFVSDAVDITLDNPLGHLQIFLRDRVANTTTRLTHPWNGVEFSTTPFYSVVVLSGDGRFVLFASNGNDEFTENDNIGVGDVYVLDRNAGTTELISRPLSGMANGSSAKADISDDGRIVAFHSFATNLLASPVSGRGIYLRDRWTNEQISLTEQLPGSPSIGPFPDVSDDGRHVAFDWRVTSSAYPELQGRHLVYMVDVLGIPLPRLSEIPTLSRSLLALFAVVIGLIGALSLHRRRRRI